MNGKLKILITVFITLLIGFVLMKDVLRLIDVLKKNKSIFTFLVDPERVRLKAKVKNLNRQIPSFEELILFSRGEGSRNPHQLKPYTAYYKALIEVYPSMGDAYGVLGYCLYHQGEYPSAIVAMSKAAALSPQSFKYPYQLGLIYYKLGLFKEAAKYFQLAVSINPEVSLAKQYSSRVYQQILKGSAVDQKDLAFKLKEDYQFAFSLLCQSLYKSDRYEEMLNVARTAERMNFDKGDQFLYYQGLAAFKVNDYPKAVEYLKKSLAANPDNADALHTLGLCLNELGRKEKALEAILQAEMLRKRQSDPINQIKIDLF